MRCTGVCHGRSFLKKYQLKTTRGVAAGTAKANTAVDDKLKPEQIESSCWRVSLFESRACQNTLGDVDSRRLSHLGQGKEQAKQSGPRRDQSGEQRQGSSLSRELVADGIWHPSGLGCASDDNNTSNSHRHKGKNNKKAKAKASMWTWWKRISLPKQLQPCRILHRPPSTIGALVQFRHGTERLNRGSDKSIPCLPHGDKAGAE